MKTKSGPLPSLLPVSCYGDYRCGIEGVLPGVTGVGTKLNKSIPTHWTWCACVCHWFEFVPLFLTDMFSVCVFDVSECSVHPVQTQTDT